VIEPTPGGLRFDFNSGSPPEETPTEPGFIGVPSFSSGLFDPTKGFGWESSPLGAGVTSSGGDLYQDRHQQSDPFGERTFAAVVHSNTDYTARLHFRSFDSHTGINVRNADDASQSASVDVSPFTPTVEQFVVSSDADGLLRLTFSGGGVEGWLINGLEIIRVPTGTPVDQLDFGDAAPSFGTMLSADGARHTIDPNGPYLGSTQPDAELDGHPSSNADGDDVSATDDEDDIVFTPTLLVAGHSATVELLAPNGGMLNAWIDFDQNGVFEAAEQIATDMALSTGLNIHGFTVTSTAVLGNATARFRINSGAALAPPAWPLTERSRTIRSRSPRRSTTRLSEKSTNSQTPRGYSLSMGNPSETTVWTSTFLARRR